MTETNLPKEIQEIVEQNNPSLGGQNELYARIYRRGLEIGLATQMFHDEASRERFSEWVQEQDRKVTEKQGKGRPYYGCSGGELVYTYCPMTIGIAINVRHEMTGEELNLSDWS